MKLTQEQMFRSAQQHDFMANQAFMEMVKHPTNPITKQELRALIERNAALWSQFSNWLESDLLPEGE